MSEAKLNDLIEKLDETLDRSKLRSASGRDLNVNGIIFRREIEEILDKYRNLGDGN